MRPRTLLLLILVLVVAVAAAVLIIFSGTGDGPLAGLLQGDEAQPQEPGGAPQAQEPGQPSPTATPVARFVPVVVARVNLPVGERITRDLIGVERRPDDNVGVLAQVTVDDPELVVGQIVRTSVTAGQEILRPMLALNPSDLATLGSDLSLYVDQGKVAVAFPIDRFSGAAYAMRPGDQVDALMSLTLVEVDEEFQTKRLNIWERVFEPDLLEGRAFLFAPAAEGRLELIPVLNTVGVVGPGGGKEQIPRRVTQLTLQQMEVLWVGNWLNPVEALAQEFKADAVLASDSLAQQAAAQQVAAQQVAEGEPVAPEPTPTKERPEDNPDVVILSMTAQDALVLKWALEVGININLALRAQGDTSVYITTSVSLPQLVEQGGLAIPEPSTFGLEPRIDELPAPDLPDIPEQP